MRVLTLTLLYTGTLIHGYSYIRHTLALLHTFLRWHSYTRFLHWHSFTRSYSGTLIHVIHWHSFTRSYTGTLLYVTHWHSYTRSYTDTLINWYSYIRYTLVLLYTF